jgi:hypothetical protein
MPALRHLTAAAALLLGLAGAAQAQQVLKPADNDDLVVTSLNLKVEDIEDADLVDANGDDIGDVEAVLVDANGQPAAITAEVGGFLGMGEKEVVIGLDQVQLKDDDLMTSLTKEQLGALQPWEN